MQTMPGIIGGSGIIRIDTPKGASWTKVPTPWATPSGAIRAGRLSGLPAPWGHGRPRRRLDAACAHDLSVDAGAAVFHPGGKPGFTAAQGAMCSG